MIYTETEQLNLMDIVDTLGKTYIKEGKLSSQTQFNFFVFFFNKFFNLVCNYFELMPKTTSDKYARKIVLF